MPGRGAPDRAVGAARGSVEAGGPVGRGTTAELWLPVTAMRQDAAVVPISAPEAIDQPLNLRVLVVDDDSLVLMNTAALLEDMGYVVTEANSAADALALFKDGSTFDLLITDQAMPGMVGTQLIEKTREIAPDLPVILASGYGELPEAAIHNVIKLAKPFGQAQLAAAIRKVEIEQQALTDADRAPAAIAAL